MTKKYVVSFDTIQIDISTVESSIRIYNRKKGDTCKYFEIECDTYEEASKKTCERLRQTYIDCELAIKKLKQKQEEILDTLTDGIGIK